MDRTRCAEVVTCASADLAMDRATCADAEADADTSIAMVFTASDEADEEALAASTFTIARRIDAPALAAACLMSDNPLVVAADGDTEADIVIGTTSAPVCSCPAPNGLDPKACEPKAI